MSKLLIVFASTLIFAALSLGAVPKSNVGDREISAPRSLVSEESRMALYPMNVECKDFDKTGYKVWQHRDRSAVDLGNWDGAFPITGAIEPGSFVRRGIDLYDVLQVKCGLSAEVGRVTS